MRKYFPIYEEAVSHIWLCNCSILNFLIYEENFIFFFISAESNRIHTPVWVKLFNMSSATTDIFCLRLLYVVVPFPFISLFLYENDCKPFPFLIFFAFHFPLIVMIILLWNHRQQHLFTQSCPAGTVLQCAAHRILFGCTACSPGNKLSISMSMSIL